MIVPEVAVWAGELLGERCVRKPLVDAPLVQVQLWLAAGEKEK